MARSTYELTSDTQIVIGQGFITAFTVMTDGANDAEVLIYDVADSGDAAAGNKLAEWFVTAANRVGGRDFNNSVKFVNGMWIDINGTGASAIVEWKKS